MRSLTCLCLILPLTALAASEGLKVPSSLDLFVGSQLVIDTPAVQKIAVGDKAIVDVKVVGERQLLLIAIAAGETTVRVWPKGSGPSVDVKVRVGKAPTKATAEDEKLTLKRGEERVLTQAGITRVAVGDTEIVDVKTIGNDQLKLIAGQQVAGTTLIIWTGETRKAFQINVVR